jgi:hypothetical protein
MNKIEIEIPVGKEVDWEASAKQKQIVLKDKQLTYEDVCEELFKKDHYYTNDNGNLRFMIGNANDCPNNATTKHQLECILAKNKLANVARYLNGEWKWELGSLGAFVIINTSYEKTKICLTIDSYGIYCDRANVLFKSREAAQQAIKILGEETVKLALEPLY